MGGLELVVKVGLALLRISERLLRQFTVGVVDRLLGLGAFEQSPSTTLVRVICVRTRRCTFRLRRPLLLLAGRATAHAFPLFLLRTALH